MLNRFLRRIRNGASEFRRHQQEKMLSIQATPHPNPILIFGNQKSGTSAIAGLLGIATGLDARIDFVGGWSPHIHPLIRGEEAASDYIKKNAWSFSFPIIKEPNLTFAATQVMDAMSVDRAIFVVRHPFDNIRSILDRLLLKGNCHDLALADRVLMGPAWTSILTGTDLLTDPGSPVEALAIRWVRAVASYQSAKERFRLVKYEDFNSAKTETIAGIASEFGLQIHQDIATHLDHRFQPPGTKQSDYLAYFGPENHELITGLCASAAAKLDYSLQ